MNIQVVENPTNRYVECLVDDERIENEQDALDLVAQCGEHQVYRLLLHGESLSDDFYHLKTGLAGAVLLKFSNYSLKVATVLTHEKVGQGYFSEMVLEANRSNRDFHVFYDKEKAEEWLVSD